MKPGILAAMVLLATAVPAWAAPGDMSVAEFLRRADHLRSMGPLALLSGDVRVLRQEGEAAGRAYRSRLQTERAAGNPSSCPPQPVRVNSDQMLAHLRTYPVAARPNTTMRTAAADFMIRTYPCRS